MGRLASHIRLFTSCLATFRGTLAHRLSTFEVISTDSEFFFFILILYYFYKTLIETEPAVRCHYIFKFPKDSPTILRRTRTKDVSEHFRIFRKVSQYCRRSPRKRPLRTYIEKFRENIEPRFFSHVEKISFLLRSKNSIQFFPGKESLVINSIVGQRTRLLFVTVFYYGRWHCQDNDFSIRNTF